MDSARDVPFSLDVSYCFFELCMLDNGYCNANALRSMDSVQLGAVKRDERDFGFGTGHKDGCRGTS
jgi:hypothetical protein